jgi:hypothetical protein
MSIPDVEQHWESPAVRQLIARWLQELPPYSEEEFSLPAERVQ